MRLIIFSKFILSFVSKEDDIDQQQPPLNQAQIARQQRNLMMDTLMKRKKLTEEQQKERAKCLLNIMDNQLTTAQNRANDLQKRLSKKNTQLDQIVKDFQQQQLEKQNERLHKKIELAEREALRAEGKLVEFDKDYQLEDVYDENKNIYDEVDRYLRKGGEQGISTNYTKYKDDQDYNIIDQDQRKGLNEDGVFQSDIIEKMYAKAKGGVKKRRDTSASKRIVKPWQIKQGGKKVQIAKSAQNLLKQKMREDDEQRKRPVLVQRQKERTKQNLRLEKAINTKIGETFQFLGQMIEKQNRVYQDIQN